MQNISLPYLASTHLALASYSELDNFTGKYCTYMLSTDCLLTATCLSELVEGFAV